MRPAVSFFILLLATTTVQAGVYPFEGSWTGGPATCTDPFRFTSSTYRLPGGKSHRLTKVHRDGDWFDLRFPGGYRLTLASVNAKP